LVDGISGCRRNKEKQAKTDKIRAKRKAAIGGLPLADKAFC